MTWVKGQSGNPRGRPPGRLNKFALEKAREIAQAGDLPCDFLVAVYRDERLDMKLRVDAARAAAPYLHPRLATSEMDIVQDEKRSIEDYRDEDLLKIIEGGKVT